MTGAVTLSASDVGALPSSTAIPSKTSDLTNDSGYLTYPDTISNADQLLSTSDIGNQVPYLLRQTPSGVGNRLSESIVGGTVAWNQVLPKHNSYIAGNAHALTISVENGYINISGTAESNENILVLPSVVAVPANHVVLMICDGWNGFAWRRSSFPAQAKPYYMNKHSENFGAFPSITITNGETYNIHARFCSFDLTQMFGSTVADYIYSLEQSSTGAGVAFFRKLFPKDYYEYNTGELMSVEGLQSHDMVGFNQWDEEWETGTYLGSTGEPVNATSRIRSKNTSPIRVFPNTVYCFTSPSNTARISQVCWYDIDDKFIKAQGGNTEAMWLLTSPAKAYYMRFHMSTEYGATYNNDICINISSDRNGEYEPYIKHSYPLDSSLTLRGIPKLSDGLYFDGDTYEADGTVTRKYGIRVFDGSETWTARGVQGSYTCSDSSFVPLNAQTQTTNRNLISSAYPASTWEMSQSTDKVVSLFYYQGLHIHDTSFADVTALKEYLSQHPITVVYELATPTTESATPFADPQTIISGGSESYTVDSSADVILPVGHDSKYTKDLRGKLEAIPDNLVQSVNGKTGVVTIANATTSANGLMSATDKSRLDDLYADYSSALTALGV